MQAAENRKRKEKLETLKEMKDDPIDDDNFDVCRAVGRNGFAGEKSAPRRNVSRTNYETSSPAQMIAWRWKRMVMDTLVSNLLSRV